MYYTTNHAFQMTIRNTVTVSSRQLFQTFELQELRLFSCKLAECRLIYLQRCYGLWLRGTWRAAKQRYAKIVQGDRIMLWIVNAIDDECVRRLTNAYVDA